MSKDKHFHQYGYDFYLRAPQRPLAPSGGGASKTRLLRRGSSPAVASVVLLVAAVLFVGVVIFTYPAAEKEPKPIPIVRADLSPIKRAPDAPGGMSIPNADSTVLARSAPDPLANRPGIENLLARSAAPEPMVMKEEAIEEAMRDAPAVVAVAPEEVPVIEVVEAAQIEAPDPSSLLQKIEPAADAPEVSSFEDRAALAAVAVKPNHTKSIHAPGQSPETLAFVRRVLSDEQAAAIEPSAGAAKPAALAPGAYYVQLASIKDRGRADSEWRKMQAKYNALGAAEYRVQQASLSAGTFYRIQAGPMSKASADKVCGDLKAAGKPGGCLVVK